MQFDTISISSDEDVPLNSLGNLCTDLNTTACLKTHSIQQCEFCDEVFFNRYTALIHNAKHIIIPLLKQNVYQCTECLYYFTSQAELCHHKETKHEKETNVNNDMDIDIKTELHMTISDLVKKELDIKLEDYLIQNKLNSPVKVKEELRVKVEENDDNDTKDNLQNHVTDTRLKISNRLQFESDDFDNDDYDIDESVLGSDVFSLGHGLLDDLTTVCKVNVDLFDKPWVEDEVDTNIQTPENDVNNGDDVNNVDNRLTEDTVKEENEEQNTVECAPSIHYDDLIRPGMYRCKRCGERFPTRFQLIQHDMSHVKIRKTRPLLCIYCERFISNTRAILRQHIDARHKTECSPRPKQFLNCKKCGLKYYSYTKHTQNYHVGILRQEKDGPQTKCDRPVIHFCHFCNRAFYCETEKLAHISAKHLVEKKCHCGLVSTAVEIQEHQKTCYKQPLLEDALVETTSYSAMLKLCETCCLFLKNKNNMQYTIVNSVSEVGARLDCERCGKKFFELKLVKRTILKRKERLGERERKKHLSNSARLKNIQQRLKMINKLSRC